MDEINEPQTEVFAEAFEVVDSGLREECVIRADDVVELLETLISGLVATTTNVMEIGKFVEETKQAVEKHINEYINNEDHSDPQNT